MKKNILVILMGLLLTMALVSCGQGAANHDHVKLEKLNGETLTLKDYRGKWVIINYWASWCKPCYQEIPELNAFAEKYKAKVQVLGVSYDGVKGQALAKIINKMKIEFPILKNDPSKALGIDHIQGLPATLIINPQGKLVKTLLGIQTQASLLKVTNINPVKS